jgi:hypothetical protein
MVPMPRPKPDEPLVDVHYRLPLSLYEQVRQAAFNERLSQSKVIVKHLKEALK